MSQGQEKKPVLEGRDIVFECRECGKSLSIDCRGAGLNIRCPKCDSELEVPIPEGFDLAQIDQELSDAALEEIKKIKPSRSEPDEDAATVAASSMDATGDINTLRQELEGLRAERDILQKQHDDMLNAAQAVVRAMDEFRRTLDDIAQKPSHPLSIRHDDETQKLR